MKILFTLLTALFFAFSPLLAQDFMPIRENNEVYFQNDGNGKSTRAFRLDEIQQVGSDQVLLLNQNIFTFRSEICTDKNYLANWIGTSINIKADGDFNYVSHWGHTVHVFYNAGVGERWIYLTDSTGITIEAEVIAIEPNKPFLGIKDDVKVIQLQLKSASGRLIDSPINDQTIQLSRNYGWIQFPYFSTNIEDIDWYQLVGHQELQLGVHRYSRRTIFDFQLGNEFQFYRKKNTHYTPIGGERFHSGEQTYERRILVKKEWLQDDEVRYTWNVFSLLKEDFDQEQFTRFSTRQVIETYDRLDEPIVTLTPFEYPGKPVTQQDTFRSEVKYRGANLLPGTLPSSIQRETSDFLLASAPNEHGCLQLIYNELKHVSEHYSANEIYQPGIGATWEYRGYNYGLTSSGNQWREMLYFKKGNVEGGTQIWPILPEESKSVTLFPNPSNGVFFLPNPETTEVRVFDAFGKQLRVLEVEDLDQIDLRDLPDGLYLIQLVDLFGQSVHRVIKQAG